MKQIKTTGEEPKKVLTIGGWDPCGSFGMGADIKTIQALGGHGMGVMTVVTAQNSLGWYGAEFMSAEFVAQQLDAVLSDYGADAVKTGFLGRVDLIETISSKLIEYNVANIVIDPVIVNAKGMAMFPQEVIDAYVEQLFPLAVAITPNLREINLLLNGSTDRWTLTDESLETVIAFQKRVAALGGDPAVIVKGLAQPDGRLADGLVMDEAVQLCQHDKVDTQNVSGTGDSLSAAICCFLAQGISLKEAFVKASLGISDAILAGGHWQLGQGPGPIDHTSIG